MLVEEVEGLLLGRVSLEQLTDRPQPLGPVGEGHFAGPLDRLGVVPVGQANNPCKTRTPSIPRA